MPEANVTRRRHVPLVDVTQAASEVSRLVHEARDLNLPVEPGVRDGRDARVRWAVLPEDVIPKPAITPNRPLTSGPVHAAGPSACR
jgi:hypothetical protein